jgi:serine/threonine protein kinase
MEYCAGGDLFSYLEKRSFKIPENKSAEIIHKLATAIYYIHSYGITHRDLKPENILMTDTTDESDIRLVDFGLSKIIGPEETCNEPFGTLSYVAPEVLLELPYNKMVDIWSLGVITYLLLCGCLPFDDEHSEKEVARKTIYEPVPFPNYFWKSISLEAKNFVFSKWFLIYLDLLQKDPTKRLSIKQVLEHNWIKKNNKTLPEIRKKSREILYSTFKIYTTSESDVSDII